MSRVTDTLKARGYACPDSCLEMPVDGWQWKSHGTVSSTTVFGLIVPYKSHCHPSTGSSKHFADIQRRAAELEGRAGRSVSHVSNRYGHQGSCSERLIIWHSGRVAFMPNHVARTGLTFACHTAHVFCIGKEGWDSTHEMGGSVRVYFVFQRFQLKC